MLMECLISREGNTTLTMEKYSYEFKVRPELTNGDGKARVCLVNSADHVDRLIECGMYREYAGAIAEPPAEKPPQTVVETKTRPSLSLELFAAMTNVNSIKSAIKYCADRDLIRELGAREHASPTRRQWVIDVLNEKLETM